MKGYKLPVTLLHNTASAMKEYLKEQKAPNTGYCFGFEIEFVDEIHILFHLPRIKLLEQVPLGDDGKFHIEDIAQFINCASNLDFTYDFASWYQILTSPVIDVQNTSFMSFRID